MRRILMIMSLATVTFMVSGCQSMSYTQLTAADVRWPAGQYPQVPTEVKQSMPCVNMASSIRAPGPVLVFNHDDHVMVKGTDPQTGLPTFAVPPHKHSLYWLWRAEKSNKIAGIEVYSIPKDAMQNILNNRPVSSGEISFSFFKLQEDNTWTEDGDRDVGLVMTMDDKPIWQLAQD